MLDQLVADMLAEANLTPDQRDRVQAMAAKVVAQMGPLDFLIVGGKLMAAKACIDAGDVQDGFGIVRELAEKYGVAGDADQLMAEIHSTATAV